jgi:hypothetical protein
MLRAGKVNMGRDPLPGMPAVVVMPPLCQGITSAEITIKWFRHPGRKCVKQFSSVPKNRDRNASGKSR